MADCPYMIGQTECNKNQTGKNIVGPKIKTGLDGQI